MQNTEKNTGVQTTSKSGPYFLSLFYILDNCSASLICFGVSFLVAKPFFLIHFSFLLWVITLLSFPSCFLASDRLEVRDGKGQLHHPVHIFVNEELLLIKYNCYCFAPSVGQLTSFFGPSSATNNTLCNSDYNNRVAQGVIKDRSWLYVGRQDKWIVLILWLILCKPHPV